MINFKIGFVLINFNNAVYTRQAIDSLSAQPGRNNCIVVIVDNGSEKMDVDKLAEIKKDYPSIHIYNNRSNVGYFNGLNIGIRYLRENVSGLNYVVVGNNDLVFPPDFISSIYDNLKIINKYAVIAPNIITLDGIHQNPHAIKKLSKFREILLDLYHVNYYLAKVMYKIGVATKKYTSRKDQEQHEIAQTIHQGFGACYILGPLFFSHFESLWAPTFLMGEELFLSQQLTSKGLSIYYEPSIIVKHHYHATIDNVPDKKRWEISRESHRIYRKYVKIF